MLRGLILQDLLKLSSAELKVQVWVVQGQRLRTDAVHVPGLCLPLLHRAYMLLVWRSKTSAIGVSQRTASLKPLTFVEVTQTRTHRGYISE